MNFGRALDRGGWRLEYVGALAAAALVFLFVYGSELGNFSLSIDEEVATFLADRGQVWLQQGRWGMAIVSALLPDFEAVPLVSTLLFGLGLLATSACALRDLRLRGGAAFLFAVVHTGFPLWLHLAEFNTLAAGFGLGLAAAAAGSGLLLRAESRERAAGVLLLAFAFAVYQTLLMYAALYLLLALHARWREAGRIGDWPARLRDAVPVLLGGVAALALYWLVQKLALLATGLVPEYIGGYVQVEALRADPVAGLRRALRYGASLLSGKHPIYLGWGLGLLFLVWPGLWPWRRSELGAPRRDWPLELFVIGAGLFLVLLPALPSLASLPARAYVAWPLLAAWLASRLGPLFARHSARWLLLALAVFSLFAASIGAALFHADRVVHAADAALARELGTAIERAAGDTRPIRFTLVGRRGYPLGGQLRRVEVFGESFFDHDGGNVYRVAYLLRLQGVDSLEPVWLAREPVVVQAQQRMPAWPQPGSVQKIDGVVVVKLGEATPPQLATP